jgi:hypothetical protein
MKYYADADFDLVLRDPPAGILDRRSWNYWNLRYHHEPVPPLPHASASRNRVDPRPVAAVVTKAEHGYAIIQQRPSRHKLQ